MWRDFTWISSSEICCWSSAMAAMLSASRSLTAITSSLLWRKTQAKEMSFQWKLKSQYKNKYHTAFVYFLFVCVTLAEGISWQI